MSANGDDGGFGPHPGDPWHPGFGEGEDAPDAVQPLEEEELSRAERKALRKEEKRRDKEAKRAAKAAGDEPEPEPEIEEQEQALPGDDEDDEDAEGRRSWFRRRSRALDEPIPDYPDDEGTPIDESLFMPPAASAEPAVEAAETQVDPADADLPSWLSAPEGAADEEPQAAVPESVVPEPAEVEGQADPEPEHDFATPPPPAAGQVRAPQAEDPVSDEPDFDALAEALAPPVPDTAGEDAGHGVASAAVYEALRDLDDDPDEWAAFVETDDAAEEPAEEHLPPALDPMSAAGADLELGESDEPARRRRIFGRRRKDDAAEADEQDAGGDVFDGMSYDPDETQVMDPSELPAAAEAEAPSWVSSPLADDHDAPSDDLHPAPVEEVVDDPGEPLHALGGMPDVDDLLETPVDDAQIGSGLARDVPVDPAAAFQGVEPEVPETPLEAALTDAPDGGPREVAAPSEAPDDVDDDAGRVPRSWFSDLDDADDEVEVEWPADAATDAAAAHPVGTEPDAGPILPGVQWGSDPADDMTVMDPIVVDEAAAEWGAAPTAADAPSGPEDDLPFPPAAPRPPEPLVLGEDDEDEEWVEDDEVAVDSDVDDWVTGPVDVDGDTEEVDADEVEEWSRTVYRSSVTTEHRGLAEELARRIGEEDDTELQALSAAMPGLGTGVVGFEDVADLGHEEDEYVESARSDLGVRLVTATILLGLLLGSLWVAGEALAVFIGCLMFLGLGEFYATLRLKGYQPIALFGFIGGGGALVGTWFYGPVSIPVAIIATAVLTFFFYAFAPRRRDALTNGGLTVLGVAWVACTAAFAFPILEHPHYKVLVFGVAAAVMASDVGAYFFGRTWGSSPLAPILSPNKSVEGLAGGVIMAIGVAVLIGRTMEPFDIKVGAALGLMVALLAPLGDLAESMVKRSLGVKDMGSVLPGHGGILDRVDAFLFVLPGAWVLFVIAGLI